MIYNLSYQQMYLTCIHYLFRMMPYYSFQNMLFGFVQIEFQLNYILDFRINLIMFKNEPHIVECILQYKNILDYKFGLIKWKSKSILDCTWHEIDEFDNLILPIKSYKQSRLILGQLGENITNFEDSQENEVLEVYKEEKITKARIIQQSNKLENDKIEIINVETLNQLKDDSFTKQDIECIRKKMLVNDQQIKKNKSVKQQTKISKKNQQKYSTQILQPTIREQKKKQQCRTIEKLIMREKLYVKFAGGSIEQYENIRKEDPYTLLKYLQKHTRITWE